MIDFNAYPILCNNKSTLKETSKDNSDKNNIKYMTESQLEVINFDKVKEQYVKDLKSIEANAKSVDALMVNAALDKIFFIEFKNGRIVKKESEIKFEIKYQIESKIKDSLLIFCDIIKKNISYTRENLIFILVYNGSKNSREKIAQHINNMAKKEFVLFGLEKLKGLSFKEIYTYTEKEFADYLQKTTLGYKEKEDEGNSN